MEVIQNKFAFFSNFAETINQLPEEKKADAYKAICEYGIYGVLPNDILLKSICLMAQNSIFKNEGGAPKGNQNAKKGEKEKQLKQPQNNPKTTPKQPTFQETETRNKKQETENITISDDMVVKKPVFDVNLINQTLQKFNLATIKGLTDERKTKLRQRCDSVGGFDNFLGQLEVALAESSFLRGENKQGWKADFDFFLQKSSWQKVVEGSYKDKNFTETKHTIGDWA